MSETTLTPEAKIEQMQGVIDKQGKTIKKLRQINGAAELVRFEHYTDILNKLQKKERELKSGNLPRGTRPLHKGQAKLMREFLSILNEIEIILSEE